MLLTFKEYISEAVKFKIDANRGDVAEVILGAGVAAKFAIRPSSPITVADIQSVLAQVIQSNPVKFDRSDAEVSVQLKDGIRFRVSVPRKAYDFMSDSSNWDKVGDLFDSVISYVNGNRRLDLQSKVLYRNGVVNDIFINSDGTGDQSGTKADIKLEVDGKVTKNQISLKVDTGQQFAQFGGITFDKQIEMWSSLGVDVSSAEAKYNRIYKKIGDDLVFSDRQSLIDSDLKSMMKSAAKASYTVAFKQLKRLFRAKEDVFANTLAGFLRKGATRNDDTVELVKFEGGKFKRGKFGKRFVQNLKDRLPKLRVELSDTEDPIVKVYDPKLGSGKAGTLFQIRAKYENKASGAGFRPYLRNLIEAGDLIYELATDV